ncbi:MAG: DUF2628 domain-containing protein [Terrisporobacter sp.]
MNCNKFSNLKTYYQMEFTQMENSPEYKGRFNVFAFLFSWIWMMAKRMYVGGVVYICLVGWLIRYVHPVFSLIFAIILGFKGNYMYYNYYINKTYKLW